jgi:hypothetical protein
MINLLYQEKLKSVLPYQPIVLGEPAFKNLIIEYSFHVNLLNIPENQCLQGYT